MSRNLRIFLLLSTYLFIRPTPARPQEDEFAKRLRAGTEEARQGSLSAATADLESAVQLDPANPEAWYQLGLLRGQIGDFTGAESAFRRVIRLKSAFPQAHYSLGLTLIANPRSKLDWPSAIAEFREALKYQPNFAEARNLLGAGLTSAGDLDAAIVELQRAIQEKPSLPEAHFNLAIAFEKKDRLEDSVVEYRAAVAARGGYPEASTALAKLLLSMGKASEAEQELEKAVRQNPDLADAHYLLARVLQSLKKTRQAESEFNVARNLLQRPADAMQSSTLSNQGLELAFKGDFKAATESVRIAILLKPDYGVPHYNLGLILADQGDLSASARELSKAISLLPGQPMPWYQLGKVLSLSGQNDRAFDALAWAARLSPSDPKVRSELVSAQALRNKSHSFEPALQTPSSPPEVGATSDTAASHSAFAQQLVAEGDYLGAVGELLRSLVLLPADLVARRNLAKSYENLSALPNAVIEYQKILCANPNDADSHLALGKIFLQQGNAEQAIAELQMALREQPDSPAIRSALREAQRLLSNP